MTEPPVESHCTRCLRPNPDAEGGAATRATRSTPTGARGQRPPVPHVPDLLPRAQP
jgi:hypothetical protein